MRHQTARQSQTGVRQQEKNITSNENRRVGNFRDGVSSATPDLLFQADGANKPSTRLELFDGAFDFRKRPTEIGWG
jgi:hypothetical protein